MFFVYIEVEFKGVKLYRYVFVMEAIIRKMPGIKLHRCFRHKRRSEFRSLGAVRKQTIYVDVPIISGPHLLTL